MHEASFRPGKCFSSSRIMMSVASDLHPPPSKKSIDPRPIWGREVPNLKRKRIVLEIGISHCFKKLQTNLFPLPFFSFLFVSLYPFPT